MFKKILLIAVAGGIGTLARYGLAGLVQRFEGISFPLGTLAVNLIGCFGFGLVWSFAEERFLISGETRALLLTGFMGAFTTFSTYIFETGQLMRDSEWLLAGVNLTVQTIGGIICFFVGLMLGKLA